MAKKKHPSTETRPPAHIDQSAFLDALHTTLSNQGTLEDLTQEVWKIMQTNEKNVDTDGNTVCKPISKSQIQSKLSYLRQQWGLNVKLKRSANSPSERAKTAAKLYRQHLGTLLQYETDNEATKETYVSYDATKDKMAPKAQELLDKGEIE